MRDEIERDFIVIIEFESEVFMNYDFIVESVEAVTDVDDKIIIAVKYNDDGSVFEVDVFVNKRTTAFKECSSENKTGS